MRRRGARGPAAGSSGGGAEAVLEAVAQQVLLHLAHGVPRQFVDEEHLLRHLEVGKLRLAVDWMASAETSGPPPARFTTATTASPKSGCGTPMTADSCTPGIWSMQSSISFG